MNAIKSTLIFLISALLTVSALGQNFLDPFFKAQLDLYYLQQLSNVVKSINIADGSISASKLADDFDLLPSQVIGVALVQTDTFSGPNISGPYNNLVIVGFYPSSNPSNFVTSTALSAQNFATEGFVTSQGYLTTEVDPAVTGYTGNIGWTNIIVEGAAPPGVGYTNNLYFHKGVLITGIVDGVAFKAP